MTDATDVTDMRPAPSAEARVGRLASARHALDGQLQSLGVLGLALLLFVATGLSHHLFWGVNNIKVLAMNASFVGLAAVGMSILIISGNIDLSVGSMLAMASVMTAIFAAHMPVPLAFVLGILVGGVLGGINGLLVWNVSTSPIIITLGMLTLLRGAVFIVTKGQAITGMPDNFPSFGNSTPLGIGTPIWIMIAAALCGFAFLAITRAGRHVYAIGGNKEASRAAGVRVRRIVIGAFIANGLLVGLVGVLMASYYGAPDQTFGNGFELQVITAVIVGGVSFTGGEGGAIRAIIGAMLIETVGGAVVSFGIDPNWAYVFTGAILIVAVSLDQIVHRQRDRYQKAMAIRDLTRFAEEQRRGTSAGGGDAQSSAP